MSLARPPRARLRCSSRRSCRPAGPSVARGVLLPEPTGVPPDETLGALLLLLVLTPLSSSRLLLLAVRRAAGALEAVAVDRFLAQLLRPHQQEGVRFLYECVSPPSLPPPLPPPLSSSIPSRLLLLAAKALMPLPLINDALLLLGALLPTP